MHAAQNPGSKLKYVTLDKESNMSTLWRREEFLRVCSEEDLAEKAQAIEMIIPVGKSQVARYNFDPASFFVNRFWGRRPDGVAINEALRIVNTLEFNRSKERDEGFLEVKEAEANQQHKSIIGAFREAAPKWEFDQIDFVVGNRGSVVESDFYTKLKKLDVQEGKKDKLFADTGMRSARLGDSVLPPAHARTCKANHRGIEGEHWVQYARVRRCKDNHTLTERQSWGPSNNSGLRIVNWKPQSKTPPKSGRRTHLLYFTYSYCVLSPA